MKLKYFLTISVLIALSFSCASLNKLRSSKDGGQFFESAAQITISTAETSFNFAADIHFTLKDSFHIAVKGPFGISAGDVFIINSRFIYINKLERLVFSGENSDGQLETVFQIPISPDILSKLPLLPHLIKQQQIVGENYLNFRNVKLNRKKLINAATFMHKDGNIIFSFDDFKKVEGIYFPNKILIKHEREGKYLQITFKSIKSVNKKFPEPPVIDESYNQL
ncbi:MAG: DUF4292 domain-containing protein [Calditrichia bacterium]|nr:DUF4292 domain-containing protein [Calditrichia bacterium]